MPRVEILEVGNRAGAAKGIVRVSSWVLGATPSVNVFIADQGYRIFSTRAWKVAGGSAGTVEVHRLTGTEAPTAGLLLSTTSLALSGVSTTVHDIAIVGPEANRELAVGDRISLRFAGTYTGLVMLYEMLLIPLHNQLYNKRD